MTTGRVAPTLAAARAPDRPPLRFRALAVCACAFLVYAALGLATHRAFGTNAFDLSVFDYAIWSTASQGQPGYVPMFRYSLFAQHFMPTLLALAPFGLLFDSPEYLIVLQTLFHAVAAFLLYRFAVRHVSPPMAMALMVAFLLSRRSHSAVSSYFYIESAEPLLVFGALLAWSSGRRIAFWLLVVAALGCKEDVAIYVGAFGLMLAVTGRDRRLGFATMAVAAAWLLVATLIAIPYMRGVYGLSGSNHFLDARYGISGDGIEIIGPLRRIFSFASISRIVTITSATSFLCLLSPAWIAVAVPGILFNLAAAPGTGQAGLIGHYLWPILPWLFVAAVFGARRLPSATAKWTPLVIIAVALIDAPLPRSLARAPWNRGPEATQVSDQLRAVPATAAVVAQPNLIPHMPRRTNIYGLGVYSAGQPAGDYVLLTTVGDLWPFDTEGVKNQAAALAADPAYEQVAAGPLFAFRRR